MSIIRLVAETLASNHLFFLNIHLTHTQKKQKAGILLEYLPFI